MNHCCAHSAEAQAEREAEAEAARATEAVDDEGDGGLEEGAGGVDDIYR